MSVSNRVLVIAEAGVNHDGSLAKALELVDAAAACGADVVKFQSFKASGVVSRTARKAEYQVRNTGAAESQREMIRKLELSPEAHHELMERCRQRGIRFLSSPFDLESVDLLCGTLGLDTIKLGSGEITHAAILLESALRARKVILSTGMSTLAEVEAALGALAFGWLLAEKAELAREPGNEAFRRAFLSARGQELLKERLILLHCTTEYPAPFEEVNLRAMRTLSEAFGIPVGFSDHTPGIAVPIAAVAMGACVIEKHFTLDSKAPGPDHAASLEPSEFGSMVKSIRQVELALGSTLKGPTASELKNVTVARRSLVARKAVRKGELFTAESLSAKRPAGGISPFAYWDWLGKPAPRDFEEDEPIAP